MPTLSSYCLLRQGFIHSRLASYLVGSWEWPWTSVSPTSASQELGLQVYTTILCLGATEVEPRPNSQALYQLEPQPQPVLLAAQRGWLLQASLVCVQCHLLRKAVFGSLILNLWLTLSVFFTHSTVCSLPQLTLLPAKCKPDRRLHGGKVTRHVFCTACSSVLEISQCSRKQMLNGLMTDWTWCLRWCFLGWMFSVCCLIHSFYKV